MRPLSPAVAAWTGADVHRRCTVWRLTRKDGLALGFTDHDAPLTVAGILCEPARSLQVGEIELSDDLTPDVASLGGAIESAALTEVDLAAGLWDGAAVDVFAVDWGEPDRSVRLFSGRLGEVSRSAQAFEAEARGLQAPLSAAGGRTLARRCDAQLGDDRCGMNLSAFTYAGVVADVPDDRTLSVTGLTAHPTGWFEHGVIVFSGGARRSVKSHHAPGLFRLHEPLPPTVSVGQTVTVIAGCDKAAETCRIKFQNIINFQGFPHMPGNDAVAAGPHGAEPRDGSSRFR